MTNTPDQAWRCIVCGYVHRGAEAPRSCPVCGAPGDDFERLPPAAPPVAPPPPPVAARWRCVDCGYAHDGPAPPAVCPVCGAPAGRFEPFAATEAAPAAGGGLSVAIVGGGVAGLAALEAILELAPGSRATLYTQEGIAPYSRLNLTRYLAGELSRADLAMKPASFYERPNVELALGVEVRALDAAGLALELAGGRRARFDRIILACGAHPFMPPIPGAYRRGVMALRTLDDADRILALAGAGARVVCIGGGLLGLETAGALVRRGVRVTLLESFPWLLPRQLHRAAGERLERYVREAGIETVTGAKIEEIAGDESVRAVAVAGRDPIHADLVLVTAGVRPNSYLARQAGIRVKQGVVVDRRLATSAPGVYAAGDVAEFEGTLYGLWAPALYMGRIAGMNAVGGDAEFGGVPRSNALKVLGVDVYSVGRVEPEDGSWLEAEREEGGNYYRFLAHDGRLVGAIFVGDAALGAKARQALEAGDDLSAAAPGGRLDAARVLDHLRAL